MKVMFLDFHSAKILFFSTTSENFDSTQIQPIYHLTQVRIYILRYIKSHPTRLLNGTFPRYLLDPFAAPPTREHKVILQHLWPAGDKDIFYDTNLMTRRNQKIERVASGGEWLTANILDNYTTKENVNKL
jgi:hypothetical protein